MQTLTRFTASTGFDQNKLATYANLLSYFRRNHDLAARDAAKVFHNALTTLKHYFPERWRSARVVEIGSGQHATITLLFHSLGIKATGIDMDYVRFGFAPLKYFNIIKANGFERALKTFVRNVFFDPGYYQTVEEHFGLPLKTKTVDLRRMNSAKLAFKKGSVDYFFSFAVFEHLQDVDATCREMARALKKDGVANISIDLFPSPSGGHNLEWAFPDLAASKRVPAWDHLRDNRFPTHVYLNKLREKDYRKIFLKYFTIVEEHSTYEGRKLLTKKIARDLIAKGYTREELLKRTWRVVLKKK
jgi:SAM-dependent methyltransferase